MVEWTSLRNGLILAPAVAVFGGIAFLVSAFFIVQDRRDAENNIDCKYNLLYITFRAMN